VNLILGAGLAGLSVSWHLGHDDCLVLERSHVIGGHARSIVQDGFTLDHGPHVSFTRHAYVRDLFAENVDGAYEEFPVIAGNFYHGCAIDHPAQVHLWQLPDPLRTACAADMRAAAEARAADGGGSAPNDYEEWLRRSFGRTFAEALPAAYTRKYWTVDPAALSADWLGPRMHTPSPEEIEAALVPGSRNKAHYITTARYPSIGGYQRFFERFADRARIRFGATVTEIDLAARRVTVADGDSFAYDRLVSTLPLPEFVRLVPDAPAAVRAAARALDCSELLLVDVFAPKVMESEYRWFYVYDEDKLATRIHCVEALAPANAPTGMTGVQVEVYSSRHRPATEPPAAVAARVAEELVELGFVAAADLRAGRVTVGWRVCPYANVMFTHPRRAALETIYGWLQDHGLAREPDDLAAVTDWTSNPPAPHGSVVMAGRFAQWKYFWTDDCVLRGRQIAAADREPVR
jgi:protoporphyrinogen oxidase